MRRSNVLRMRGIAGLFLLALGLGMANPAAATPSCSITSITDNPWRGFPGGVTAFSVTLGAGSVTIDPNGLGAYANGWLSLSKVQGSVNATVSIPSPLPTGTLDPVTVAYTVTDPSQAADFTLDARIAYHGILVHVHCGPPVCVLTQGFWKNHVDWPVDSLNLGAVPYIKVQLLAILGEPVRGNGLVSLAKQLIAAKLNAAEGAGVPTGVAAAIAQADALIGGRISPPVGTGSLNPSATSALTTILDNYNNGVAPGGPAHCE